MTDAPPPVADCCRGLRRFVPGCGLVMLVVIAALTIAGLIGYRLYRSTPADYTRARDRLALVEPAKRYALAESLEKRVSAEISFASYIDDHGRPLPDTSDTRFILISAADVNAWLDQRLPMWLRNREIEPPSGVSDLAFWTRGDRVMLAARVRRGDFDRVVSFAVRLDVPAPGDEAVIQLVGVRVGQLPVPLGAIRGSIDDEAGHVAQLIDGLTFPTRQVIGGQAARWVSIQPVDEGLLVELRKEP